MTARAPKDPKAAERQRRSREMRLAGWIYFRGWLPPEAVNLIPAWSQYDPDECGEEIARMMTDRVTRDAADF